MDEKDTAGSAADTDGSLGIGSLRKAKGEYRK